MAREIAWKPRLRPDVIERNNKKKNFPNPCGEFPTFTAAEDENLA